LIAWRNASEIAQHHPVVSDRLTRPIVRVQIQILLQLFTLSLEKTPTEETTGQSRLESLMDKMSTWQLLNRLDSKPSLDPAENRDWMQTFCEDIVEPQSVSSNNLHSIRR
jgi:hypothetical protein